MRSNSQQGQRGYCIAMSTMDICRIARVVIQYQRDFATWCRGIKEKMDIFSTRNEPLLKILLGSYSNSSSIRYEPLRFQHAIRMPLAQKYATHRTVSIFEKLKHALVCVWPHRFSNGLSDPGFGISLSTLMDFRLGDLVMISFFHVHAYFRFPSGVHRPYGQLPFLSLRRLSPSTM